MHSPVWVDQWPLVTPVSSGDTVIPVDTDTRGFLGHWVGGDHVRHPDLRGG
ncbi:MAG: hypothetical protein MH213_01420 [Marinobacter sp.]|nr:hypothetical protein [Marinobacter sp.]